jgi:hypothetical protein
VAALFALAANLQKQIDELFCPNYKQILAAARERLAGAYFRIDERRGAGHRCPIAAL